MVAGAAKADDGFSGDYVGTYRCAQGPTDLRLSLSDDGQMGRFAFSAGGVTGAYLVRVQPAASGEYLLVPQRWERRPPGYAMVGARVRLDGDRLEGRIEAPSCGAMTARRVGAAIARPAASPQPPSSNPYRFATTRPAPPPPQKTAPADPSVFLPGDEDRLRAYLTERANSIDAMHRACLDRMQNRYPPSSRVLPAAEQIRRSQETDEMFADCKRRTENEHAGVMDEFRTAVTAWAARRPASYEGLQALNSADSEYRFLASSWERDRPPYALGRRMPPIVAEVFGRRRAEIELVIRPALQAEVLRTQSLSFVATLFNRDDKMMAPYRSLLNAQQTAAAEAAALRNVPAGPNGELALAATAAFGRAPRIAMGQSLGATTVRGTTVEVNVAVLTENYEFGARNAQCTAPAGGKTTCSYDLEFRAGGTLLGAQLPTVSSGWIKRRDVFYREAGKLRSAKLDQDMARLAEASRSSGSGGQSALDASIQRRRDDCRQQVFSSYMSGDYGTAAATGIAGCQ